MVFQQYFNYIVAVSFIGGGNQSTWRKPLTCRKSLTNFFTYCCIEYTSPRTGFELTTLVVIGTDCTGSCKPNYPMITTNMAPVNLRYSTIQWNMIKTLSNKLFIENWVNVNIETSPNACKPYKSNMFYTSTSIFCVVFCPYAFSYCIDCL
jgi:hypothetical protein